MGDGDIVGIGLQKVCLSKELESIHTKTQTWK